MNRLTFLLSIFAALATLTSCIDDAVTGDAAAQPTFSTDTLDLGDMFTDWPSPTATLMIYNRNSDNILLSSVKMRSGREFRINVDGRAGREFTDVEIRANDSVFVFVEATVPGTGSSPDPIEITDYLDVMTNGVTRSVVFKASGHDAIRLTDLTVDADMTLDPAIPYIVTGDLAVSPETTLILPAGTTVYFHDGASLTVGGTLIAEGTPQAPVILRGERLGNVVADISYEVMSNQWLGVVFTETSAGNRLAYTSITNTEDGVKALGSGDLVMVSSRIHNSGGAVLVATDCRLTAVGCQFSNAAGAILDLTRGSTRLDHCTLANYYLFAYPSEAILKINEPADTPVDITNSIVTGRGQLLDPADIKGLPTTLRRTMFDVDGSDDDNFIDCIWATDPMLNFDLEEYTFDYSPLPESPAIGTSDPAIAMPEAELPDLHGNPRAGTLGAYGPTPQQN